ncbi:Aflatoxin biosynthesis regulatory protein [Cytospora mali]|uniref:Aflatoxin biosynthesis regulatory protein n=1 Tax=Cytospora mali TaxID=578113 RepID=A0A194UQ99_CYTMA|nr:Aflatoxin biosynthesis regulatory protein [Valsa mali var. pyri (nom. inval.)]
MPVVALGSPQVPVSPVNWFGSLPAISDPSHMPTTIPVTSSTTLVSDPLGSSPSKGFGGMESDFDQFIASASHSYLGGTEKDLDILGDLGGLDSFSMVFNENDTLSLSETLPTSTDEAGTPALFSSNSHSSASSASINFFPSGFTTELLQSNHDSETTTSPCGCPIWAVGLVKQFFTDTPADSGSPSGTSTPTHHIHSAISRNKQAIDKIDAILKCSCYHDGYLLVMLSMVLLKVMDCYADAAQNKRPLALSTTTGNENTSGTSSNDISKYGNADNKGLGRQRAMSTQSPSSQSERRRSTYSSGSEGAKSARSSMHLVLGELHRPQRLVNQLSDLLQAEEAKSNGYETNNAQFLNYSGMGKIGSTGSSPSATSLFSDAFLKQLGIDLRRRLQKLSLEIRETLKRE